MALERSLVFNWHNTTKLHTLLLFFVPPGEDTKLDGSQNIIAWKVINAKKGFGSATLVYSDRIGIGQTRLCPQNLVPTSNWVEIKKGESVELMRPEGHGKPGKWDKSPVRNTDDSTVHAKNGTNEAQTFTIGSVRDVGSYSVKFFEPTYLWKNVGPMETINVNFNPTLCAVVLDDYKESQCVHNPISSENVIWRQNLRKLPAVTYFELKETDEGFEIRRDD